MDKKTTREKVEERLERLPETITKETAIFVALHCYDLGVDEGRLIY